MIIAIYILHLSSIKNSKQNKMDIKNLILTLLILVLSTDLIAQHRNYNILISFDGFRWDYPNRELTPNLDYIKQQGVHAISLKPCFPTKTFPNHYSIITGLYPENHGIIANNFFNPLTGNMYRVGDTTSVRNPQYYIGEAIWETARRQGVITASYFWPGSEVNLEYRRPNIYEKYEHKRDYKDRINGVLNWLQLPYDQRPKLITLYFDATDTYGHRYGTNSVQLNGSIMQLDSLISKLFKGLKDLNLYDSTNVIIVSDHGMTDKSSEKIINVDKILSSTKQKLVDYGPVMYVHPYPADKEKIYDLLKTSERNYKVYYREEMPDYYNFSENYIIPEILIVADPGWSLMTTNDIDRYGNMTAGGNHGYDNNFLDMHGIFFAIGPDFKNGYTCGTLQNIDINPLLAKLLKIIPNKKIDGKIERIEFLLKDR